MALGPQTSVAYDTNPRRATTTFQTVDATAQVTDATKCAARLALQITGTATAISVQLERSTIDPAVNPGNWAPSAAVISGNPSTGIQVEGFVEPGVAWWRSRIVSITGGNAMISVSTGN